MSKMSLAIIAVASLFAASSSGEGSWSAIKGPLYEDPTVGHDYGAGNNRKSSTFHRNLFLDDGGNFGSMSHGLSFNNILYKG